MDKKQLGIGCLAIIFIALAFTGIGILIDRFILL